MPQDVNADVHTWDDNFMVCCILEEVDRCKRCVYCSFQWVLCGVGVALGDDVKTVKFLPDTGSLY